MIGLVQNEDLYNYDIRSILQAFFENERDSRKTDSTYGRVWEEIGEINGNERND